MTSQEKPETSKPSAKITAERDTSARHLTHPDTSKELITSDESSNFNMDTENPSHKIEKGYIIVTTSDKEGEVIANKNKEKESYILSNNIKPEIAPYFESAADQKSVGKTLKAARISAGLSIADVAAVMGTSRMSITRIEQGEQNQGIETISRYADAVGCRATLMLTPLK